MILLSGMPQARLTDIGVGVCSHGMPCCPHTVLIIHIVLQSPNVISNQLNEVRFTDLHMKTCPHCGIGMALMKSSTVFDNFLGDHRLNDVTTEFCGIGMSVSGSPNVFEGG